MSNSKFVSCSLAIIVTSFFVCLPADAQPMSTGKANSVVVKLDVKDTSKCNIEVSTPWQEKFEVEVNPPSMEAQFEVTPREPGLLVLTWTGKTKFRGLKSVMACTGSGEVRLIAGYTSETAKPMWDKLFSTLSSEQAECVRIGLDSAKLKYTAIDPRAEVIDPTDSKAKSVFARCESFFKIKQGFIDKGTWSETQLTSCTVGGVRTMCEGAYGIPLADGKFMALSRIDAMRYHHENRPWTLYRREPQSLRDVRLAQAEQARLEEERQREAKRVADEKAAADRAKQAEEERQREAKRIAEEERQRDAKRIAEERSAMEKAKTQKNQDKKNVAKDILGGGANQSPSAPSYQGTGQPSPREVGRSSGLYFKTVQLRQASYPYCQIYFDVENSGTKTFQMMLDLLYRTPQGQVIDSHLLVITVRGGQKLTENGSVRENCNIVGSMTIKGVSGCQVDSALVSNEICWRAINVESGVIPLRK